MRYDNVILLHNSLTRGRALNWQEKNQLSRLYVISLSHQITLKDNCIK